VIEIAQLERLQFCKKDLYYARADDGAKRYQNSAALLIFRRRTTISHFAFLIFNFLFE